MLLNVLLHFFNKQPATKTENNCYRQESNLLKNYYIRSSICLYYKIINIIKLLHLKTLKT